MRVTIIGPDYPLRGGIAHHVYCLNQELTSRGHSVQVISFSNLYPALLFPGKTQMDNSESRLRAGGLPILKPLSPLTWMRAYKAVKSFSPDMIIFQWWHTFFGMMVGSLGRMFSRDQMTCVLECHNVFPHEPGKFDLSLFKFAAQPVHSFIAHSSSVRNALLPFAQGRAVSVAPLPIPKQFSASATNSRDGRTILFFGMVRKYKGLDVLLAAMPKVLAEVECKLIVAGEFYDSIDRYRALIHEYGLEENVFIDARYIPNEEIIALFNRADVLVMPYLKATQSGVSGIARANGLPIIASRSGGLPEIVAHDVNGLLFPVGDSEALAEQIIRYFKDDLGPVFAKNLRTETTQDREQLAKLIEGIPLRSHDSSR